MYLWTWSAFLPRITSDTHCAWWATKARLSLEIKTYKHQSCVISVSANYFCQLPWLSFFSIRRKPSLIGLLINFFKQLHHLVKIIMGTLSAQHFVGIMKWLGRCVVALYLSSPPPSQELLHFQPNNRHNLTLFCTWMKPIFHSCVISCLRLHTINALYNRLN